MELHHVKVQYYRCGFKYLDEPYFLRDNSEIPLELNGSHQLLDKEFFTWHDHTFSEIIASEMLIDYVREEIKKLEEQRAARIKELFMFSGQQIEEEEALIIYADYHRDFLQSCIVFPETISVLEMLKGIRLGIIINGPVADQTEKLKSNKLIDYFDPIIISDEVGFAKPKIEIFRAAA